MRESLCLDKTESGYEKVPVNSCAENDGVYDLKEWGDYLDSELKDLTGKTCTCEGSGCNYMERK